MTDQVNPKKLYVGNLPYSTTEDELRSMFGDFGEVVDVKLITDKMTGRSKGFAFVEMADEAMANAALEGLNGKDMGGRPLAVTIARPMAPRPAGGGGGYGGGSRGGYGGGRDNRGGGYNKSW